MTLARLIAIAVLTHMAFGAARMTASLYALSNNASTFTVGVIMALFSLVPMLIAVRTPAIITTSRPLFIFCLHQNRFATEVTENTEKGKKRYLY